MEFLDFLDFLIFFRNIWRIIKIFGKRGGRPRRSRKDQRSQDFYFWDLRFVFPFFIFSGFFWIFLKNLENIFQIQETGSRDRGAGDIPSRTEIIFGQSEPREN